MMLKSSFCKQVLQICKRNLWAITLSILGFCLCLPLPVAIIAQQYYSQINNYQMLTSAELADRGQTLSYLMTRAHDGTTEDLAIILGSMNIGVRVGIIIMAFLLGVALFRYLHDQRQVDLHHALPIKREQLFATRFTAGVVMVLPILWAIRLITLLIIALLGFVGTDTLTLFAWSFITDTVFFLLIFSFVAICTLITGNTIITVLLSLWAMFFVPIITGLSGYFIEQYLITYRGFTALSAWLMTRLSPVIQYCMMGYTANHTVDSMRFVEATGLGMLCIVFFLVAGVHIVLAVMLFRKRKSETSGQSVAFDWCKFPIKLSLCIVAGLCGWMLFQSIGYGSAWAVFGLVLCTAIVHAVSEIIIQHDFKALFSKKLHFGVIVAVMLGGIFSLQAGSTVIDAHIPSASSLKGVMLDANRGDTIGEANSIDWNLDTALTDPANIDIVMQLAQMGVAQYTSASTVDAVPAVSVAESTVPSTVETPIEIPSIRLEITFVPKFGLPSVRIFYIDRTAEVDDLITQLRISEAYQKIANPIVSTTDIPAQSKDMYIAVRTADVPYGDRSLATITGVAVEQILESLQQDMLSLTMEQRKNDVPLMRLDFGYTSNGGTWLSDVGIYPTFHQTIALIAAETGVLPASLNPEQVESMIVYYNPDSTGNWASVSAIERSLRDYTDMLQANDSEFVTAYALTDDIALPEDPAELQKFMEAYGYTDEMTAWMQADPITITDQTEIAQLLDGALTENMIDATDIAFQQDEQAACISVAAVLTNGDMLQLYYPNGKYPAAVLAPYID